MAFPITEKCVLGFGDIENTVLRRMFEPKKQ
jgi:hypothetical protein